MSSVNIYHYGAKKAHGMESTPAQKDLTGAEAVNGYSEMALLYNVVNWDTSVSWGDFLMERESVVMTPPITVTKSEISREEFLFRYYIDLVTDPCKYGADLEEEKAETEAELKDLGKWANVLTHLINLEEEKMKVAEERIAKDKEYAEKFAVLEEKRRKHALKIAAMKEAAAKAYEEDKARVAAKLAARNVATVKSGRACKYFRNNGMPEPAQDGWCAGCGYHKEGKCPDIHPDEEGWDVAVAKRIAWQKTHPVKGGGHHHAQRSGGGSRGGFWHGHAESRDNSWRHEPRREVSDGVRAAGGGEPAPSKPKNRWALEDDE